MTQTVVGSPATCAENVEQFITHTELDGLDDDLLPTTSKA